MIFVRATARKTKPKEKAGAYRNGSAILKNADKNNIVRQPLGIDLELDFDKFINNEA